MAAVYFDLSTVPITPGEISVDGSGNDEKAKPIPLQDVSQPMPAAMSPYPVAPLNVPQLPSDPVAFSQLLSSLSLPFPRHPLPRPPMQFINTPMSFGHGPSNHSFPIAETVKKKYPEKCRFFLSGRCHKGDNCPYRHEL